MAWRKEPGTNVSHFVVDGIKSAITGEWLVKPKRLIEKEGL